ncbi:MAG: MBL fold metallo-hydrolase [Methanobacterium sp.]
MVADAFATITQKRMTGGFRIDDIDGKNIHIDPGPGALVRTYQFGLNPLNLNGVLVSHCHTDHYTDAEILIEAMTKGMTRKKGFIIGSRSVIMGYEKWGPCISNYHLSKPQVNVLEAGESKKTGKLNITATRTKHGDPKAVGFKFQLHDFTLSYTSDTGYFKDLHREHKDTDVLLASVIRPGNDRLNGHMCADDFGKLVNEVSPKLAIMTHLGMKLIMNNPEQEAARIQENTGIKIIAARDGLKLNLDDFKTKQQTLDEY